MVRGQPPLHAYRYLTLDRAEVREQARVDPRGLLLSAPRVVLDEVQREPDLILALKEIIDNPAHDGRRTAGQFVLTGSANLLAMRAVGESLAGRATDTTLWPMTRNERAGRGIAGNWSDFFSTDASEWYDMVQAGDSDPVDWQDEARIGGYPTGALELRTASERALRFEGYLSTCLDREVRDLANIANPLDMRRLMRVACHRLGQVINRTAWAVDAGITPTTALRYLDLLEQSYQLVRVEAFSVNRTKRLVKSAKAYWSDTAMAWHIADCPPLTGFHFENLILNELLAWRDAEPRRPAVMHWRTTNQDEVDFIIEPPDGALLAVECQSSERPDMRDAKGLRLFLQEYPRAIGGVLLHTGHETRWLSDRILLVPWWRVC